MRESVLQGSYGLKTQKMHVSQLVESCLRMNLNKNSKILLEMANHSEKIGSNENPCVFEMIEIQGRGKVLSE